MELVVSVNVASGDSGRHGTGVFSGYYIYNCSASGSSIGDYSCLFKAIAHQLNRPLSDAPQIRHELVQYLKENSSSFPDLVSLAFRKNNILEP